MLQTAAYGSWKSPITSSLIVKETIDISSVLLDEEDIYWIESRPQEDGRAVIVKLDGASLVDVTHSPFNVRTRVHEYGGGDYVVSQGIIYFCNFDDQRIYKQQLNQQAEAITPAGLYCYADAIIDHKHNRLICVREDFTNSNLEPVNSIISISLADDHSINILVTGSDFYSSPRISPDGSKLVWLSWNHPNMPWDATELWAVDILEDGSLGIAKHIAGGKDESIFQPEWSPNGVLHFVSDRNGWWNLYCFIEGGIELLCEKQAEFGSPQWFFRMSNYSFESEQRIICTYNEQGFWKLATLDKNSRELKVLPLIYTNISYVQSSMGKVVFCAGSPTEANSIVKLNLADNSCQILRCSSNLNIDIGYLSTPEAIEFPTQNEQTAYGLFYKPYNKDFCALKSDKPPLIVNVHGGPTAAATTSLNLDIQYWTSRGFAVLDINYGGSTGYGRSYRQRLVGQWGVVDVEDCVNGALYLVNKGIVDKDKLIVRGASSGGFTTLCILTFYNIFKSGASYFGICDLELWDKSTHKFESNYMTSLVGSRETALDLYRERSPIHFTDRLSCPIILFQGLEDKIVPPNQSKLMFEVLCKKGLATAYVAFEEEQHGFRKAENIKRAFDAELYFYAQILGFQLADFIEPITIENHSFT